MELTPSKCFYKIADLTKPVRIVAGGSHAGKTWSILQYLLLLATKNSLNITVVMENIPALKNAAMADFFNILKESGAYDITKHNQTDRKYQINDSTFHFIGADDPDALRGKRQDITYICEATNVKWEAYMQLQSRTKYFTILCYNPSAEFWADSELIGKDYVDFIRVNYLDNEFLSQKILDDISIWESRKDDSLFWSNWWKVYGLGERGVLAEGIYSDWEVIESLPANAELLGSALDFGYSQDPTAMVSVYKINDEIIVDEVIYQKGLLNSNIADLIKASDAKHRIIYCDSAEPKSIAELRAYGLNVLPVVKGRDSINHGIQLIQQRHLKVTARSTNLIKELQNYRWMKDKEGKQLSVPCDSFNHALDALRYFFLMKFGNKGGYFNLKWKR